MTMSIENALSRIGNQKIDAAQAIDPVKLDKMTRVQSAVLRKWTKPMVDSAGCNNAFNVANQKVNENVTAAERMHENADARDVLQMAFDVCPSMDPSERPDDGVIMKEAEDALRAVTVQGGENEIHLGRIAALHTHLEAAHLALDSFIAEYDFDLASVEDIVCEQDMEDQQPFDATQVFI